MYRLMIIDDEPYMRQQIREAVNWEQLNIQIVGEATNGLRARELSAELCPDIVICDIRMPQLDGISFATEFLHRFPASQIIFISAYTDKIYLKRAIQLEAVDYIFKPFQLSDLLSAIEKALKRLRTFDSNKINSSRQQEDLALQLLYKSSYPEFTENVANEDIPIDFTKPYIAILIRFHTGISFSNYENGHILDSLEVHNLVNKHFHVFKSRFAEIFEGAFLLSQGGDGYIGFANLPENVSCDMLCQIQLTSLLSINQELQLNIGISNVYSSGASLKTAFQEARMASRSAFLTGYGRIYKSSPAFDKQFHTDHSAKREFYDNLENQKISKAASALDDYFVYLSNCNSQYISAIREELLKISLHLNQKLKKPPIRMTGEFINQACCLEEIRQYLQQLLLMYHSEIQFNSNSNNIIFKVERYITNHIGESLAVKEIAAHVHLSHTYLCYMYKKQTGKTLNQFILDVRMQKARSLLLDTDRKVGDIAISLGYVNQNYFTKTFVSYYGTTPSKFRSSRN